MGSASLWEWSWIRSGRELETGVVGKFIVGMEDGPEIRFHFVGRRHVEFVRFDDSCFVFLIDALADVGTEHDFWSSFFGCEDELFLVCPIGELIFASHAEALLDEMHGLMKCVMRFVRDRRIEVGS